ncbi:unnamed protein product [Coregonus sp. 'balchen']|nr:unnamed protein product [Coregonus sp. 'balchen']
MSPHHPNVNSAVPTQLSCAVETAFCDPSLVPIVLHNQDAMVKGFLQPLPPTAGITVIDGSPASNQLGNCTLLLWTSLDMEPRTPRKHWWTSGLLRDGDGENCPAIHSHSQLDRACTGLSQFHYALGNVKDIQNSLADIRKDWRQNINVIES